MEDFFARKFREAGVSLNESQKKAVLHTEGPLLLLASPGSGKTTTTIMRIGFLIEEKGVLPARIKAVTFSRSSALDMKERFRRFFPNQQENAVDFSTIHSLAFEVVRDYFYKKKISYQIIEGNADPNLNKKMILRNLFQQFNHDHISEDQLDELMTYSSFIKNKLVPADKWSSVKTDVPAAKEIFQEYERYKRSAAAFLMVDFDDMLTFANEAFEKDAALLRKYQHRYDYVLTDESQDTSMVQHSLIEKLVRPHQNLYVVADDDQSIYGWRAAEPEYLLNFKKVYPNAEILMMEQNYRSSKNIVEAANQFIKQNKHRYNKNMFTDNSPSNAIVIKRFEQYEHQLKYLIDEMTQANQINDVAILFRNNSSVIGLANALDRARIPFYIKDHDIRFFSHWIVKDIINFMRLSFNDKRVDIFEQIYTKLVVFVKKEEMSDLKKFHHTVSVFEHLGRHTDNSYRAKLFQECKLNFAMMKEIPPLQAIKVIRNQLGYDKALENMAKKLKFNKDNLMTILHTLENIADGLSSLEEFAARLKSLESLIQASKFNKGKDVVTLSTFHSSKGLEFRTVYMIDLIQGIIPADEDLEDDFLMEEAVRLFYVGMTRAEDKLELLSYKKHFGVLVEPSQFMRDVKRIMTPPDQLIKKKVRTEPAKNEVPINPNAIKTKTELKKGLLVKHRVFGSGSILQMDDEFIQIQFTTGMKKLSLKTCLEMGLLE